MFPKFSDLINYLFGSHLDLPIQTYGFFLAMAFVVAGIILRLELKRKEKEGFLHSRIRIVRSGKGAGWFEIVLGIILSSIMGWKFFGIIFEYHDFALNPQQYILSGKGSVAALLIIAAVSLTYHLYKWFLTRKVKEKVTEEIIHPYQNTWNIMLVAIVFALIGSKIFDIFDNFSSFLRNPVHSLFSFSGLTFYGGFIVTVFALLLYMKAIKLDWKHVIDCAAPVIMIGYAVGRLGCHFSGDGCWGIVNTLTQPHWLAWLPDWLWASYYPHNVINHGIPIPGCQGSNCMVLENPVFPTSLYESIISFISFGILWMMRTRFKAPVVLFGLFMILNGIERFFIEKIRINLKHNFLGLQLTQAEIISAVLILIGIAVMIYFSKRYRTKIENIE
ncbi:MAG: prolipoprotein diacylglyceryl transferase family protein [Lentimicrobiaceae bacterium]|jgi:prolipoprotein diacylglyceryl transferase